MTKSIMIQGTASNVGKSLIAAGLCRIFRQDGFSVAPFKSQNMALNSFVTGEGLEMGRAQVVQAEAAGIEPSVLMNPVLLKPTGEAASQVIVNGEVLGTMGAAEYYRRKTEFIPAIRSAYTSLAGRHDIIVIEGAGSPAEINLRDNDIVNMGMAAMADAPVLLVGDIDRGGVFAGVYGTLALLEPEERARVRGIVVNKFRGDAAILRPGLAQLEALTSVPVVGVVPWTRVDIDDEDSLSGRLGAKRSAKPLDAAVVRLPRIANFTDFSALDRHPAFGVRYVETLRELGRPDVVILPGTKSTMEDLSWLRRSGIGDAMEKLSGDGVPVIGICGGGQMLGTSLRDPEGAEGGGEMPGMGLLPVETVFSRRKIRTRAAGRVNALEGFFSCLSGAEFDGYEIHMGEGGPDGTASPFASLKTDDGEKSDGAVRGNVMGTYVHGLFDSGEIADRLAARLLSGKGGGGALPPAGGSAAYKERQYDILAGAIRDSLDMAAVYGMLSLAPAKGLK